MLALSDLGLSFWGGAKGHDDDFSEDFVFGDRAVFTAVLTDGPVVAEEVEVACWNAIFAVGEAVVFGDVVEVDGLSGHGIDTLDDVLRFGVMDDDDVVFVDGSDEPVGAADQESLSGGEGGEHRVAFDLYGLKIEEEEDGEQEDEKQEDAKPRYNHFSLASRPLGFHSLLYVDLLGLYFTSVGLWVNCRLDMVK